MPGALFIVILFKFLVLLQPTGLLVPAAAHLLIVVAIIMAKRHMVVVILFSLPALLVAQRKFIHTKCNIARRFIHVIARRFLTHCT